MLMRVGVDAGGAPMQTCPLCKCSADTRAPDWSGGRMTVECPACGIYEVAPHLYDELLPLPVTHWQIARLRSGLATTAAPRMIRKPLTNIAEVITIGTDKPTKLWKRFMRAKAEGRATVIGVVFHADGTDDESGS